MQTLIALLAGLALTSVADEPKLSPNAPKDRPFELHEEQLRQFDKLIAPCVRKARASYPQAKKRYRRGLPPGHIFFVTTRLRDDAGRWEQVFIRVLAIDGKTIQGTISNEIRTVSGFKDGDEYSFHQRELIDWLIARPDGTEEGNFVGKFLDEYQKAQGR